jgi:aryl-alcohol dehydrogenase-like predicted oxidoreductase
MTKQGLISDSSNRLVLGTVQLGMPYGIANKTGRPDQETATAIVHEAWNNGIREFDTAQGYGNSEKVLGKAFHELGIADDAKVVTKFDPSLDHSNELDLARSLENSLSLLGIPLFHGLMLHHQELLSCWNQGLRKIFQSFVSAGKTKFVGISVYSPDKAIQAINTPDIDFVQLPTNILDRRFEDSGVFNLAKKKGKRIYIRSIFLQGLLLLPVEKVSDKMAYVKPVIEKLDRLCAEFGMTRHEIALGYLKIEIPESQIIFGAEIPDQVGDNVKNWLKICPPRFISVVKDTFRNVGEEVLNPVLWG